jgi:CRP/FNR family cyclic AMP-dependent transcriptional regulator
LFGETDEVFAQGLQLIVLHVRSLRTGPAQNRQVPDISEFILPLQASLPGLGTPPAEVLQAMPLPRRRRLAPGQTLFAQGAPAPHFFLLMTGELSLDVSSAAGQTSSLDLLQGPALFGLSAFVTGRPSRFEARATQASQVWPIGEPTYTLLMDRWPGFARALLRRLAEHFDGNLGLLSSARHEGLGDRVKQAIRQLPFERAKDGWLQAAITQAELARLAGVSRQGTNAWLREQQRAGLLEIGYGWLRWR